MLRSRFETRWMLLWVAAWFCDPTSVAAVYDDAESETPVEYEFADKRPGPQTALGTKKYEPSEKERPFFKKLEPGEVTTGGLAGDYDIHTRNNKYVGWFGVVREIAVDPQAGTTRLLVEHKYFDGLTDLHLQAVSFNGSGDFEAILQGTDHYIDDLELVKVYGVVSAGKKDKLPTIKAEFVRCWSWGTFTFITAAGKQRGSEKWRKLNTVPLEDIYSSRPDEDYYFKRLGPTKELARRTEIEKIARQASAAMGLDPKLLRDSPGSYTKLISAEEFRNRALASAVKLQPESKTLVEPIVEAIAAEDYDRMHDAIDKALDAGMHDGVAAVLTHAYVLDDEDDTAATNALSGLSYSAGKCLPALIEALRCEDSWSRSHAVGILGDVGEPAEKAIPAIIMLLADSDEHCRGNAADALRWFRRRPEFVIPALTLALNDINSHVRWKAAWTLRFWGSEARPAAPALAELVKRDEDGNVRWIAAESLGKSGNAEVALPVLIDALSSDDFHLRRFAARGLGELGPAAEEAVPHLKKRLRDSDSGARVAAAVALWKITGNSQDSVPVLSQELREWKFPAMWAAQGVSGFGPEAEPLLSALLSATHSDNEYVRRYAVRAIAGIGPKAKSAVSRLQELLNDADERTRVFAAAALWKIGQDKDALQLVLRELESNNGDRYGIITAIGLIGKPASAALPAVRKSLTDQDLWVRRAAKETLQILEADE